MITLNEEQFNGLISHLGEQPAKFATPLINFLEQLKAEQNKEVETIKEEENDTDKAH